MYKTFYLAVIAVFCVIAYTEAQFVNKYTADLAAARMAGLLKHNQLRAKHLDTPPLVANKTLDDYAQKYCEGLATANPSKLTLVHSDFKKIGYYLGENLFGASGFSMTDYKITDTATQLWYDEIANHNFDTGTWASNTGHFTQVVWKNTKSVGFGIASAGSAVYVCANYYPPGNVNTLAYFLDNVKKLKA